MELLVVDIPEVEIKIGHEDPSSVAQSYDILDDRGAMRAQQGRNGLARDESECALAGACYVIRRRSEIVIR